MALAISRPRQTRFTGTTTVMIRRRPTGATSTSSVHGARAGPARAGGDGFGFGARVRAPAGGRPGPAPPRHLARPAGPRLGAHRRTERGPATHGGLVRRWLTDRRRPSVRSS